ncbi:hypothetical protein [Tropicibacter sp. Alg240-R139]|uniref:hypothetical protein n=1 Tax=Tropicibacter sp. Alg240-R139 TaxID=2305991 RepID=UPI0013DFBB4A|nr:hypothetical protein [Tropicibacter sp. Alg240-R139]
MKDGVRATLRQLIFLASFMNLGVPGMAWANDDCDVSNIASMVKTISILRQVENSLNLLALSQIDAIADIATGVHTLELYNHESGFYGPLGGLRKATDKNEAVLGSFDKAIRRLTTFEAVEPRYRDIRENAAQIIAAGYDVLSKLEAGDTAQATRVYASTTVVALNEARADAYTAMSGLEQSISLAGARCR